MIGMGVMSLLAPLGHVTLASGVWWALLAFLDQQSHQEYLVIASQHMMNGFKRFEYVQTIQFIIRSFRQGYHVGTRILL